MSKATVNQMEMAFASANREVKTLRIHLPAGEPKAAVLIVHGMAEHYARYQRLAERLAAEGYLVAGYDQLGHGPQTPKEKLGYFADKQGWQCLVKDVDTARTVLAQRWPGTPVVLLGHSMGSFVLREYFIQSGTGLAGLVISGSGWQPKPLCAVGLALSSVQCALGWCKKPAKLLHHLNFNGHNKPFQPARTPYDWLTRDEREVDAYAADPYCGFPLKVGGYRDLFVGLMNLTRLSRLKAIDKRVPVLFLSGTADPLAGKDGEGIRTLKKQYTDAWSQDVTVKLYPGARHELFNETNRDEVTADLLAWLNR